METTTARRKPQARVSSDPLQEKLDAKINGASKATVAVLNQIEKEGNLLKDFIAPLGNNGGKGPAVVFGGDSGLTIAFKGKDHRLHRHAVAQAAEKLGIPTAYARNLAYGDDWGHKLVAHMMNEHSLYTDRRNVLVRMVGDEVRGVLSDKYRRLDTGVIYGQFLTASREVGARVIDAFADDTRSWVDVMLPQVIPVPTENNGTRSLAFGARISNSDFGDGRLSLSAYSIELVCMNGMTRQSVISQVHLGRQIPENIQVSNRTYMADTKAQASLVRDAVGQLLNVKTIKEHAGDIQRASGIILEDPIREITGLQNRGVTKVERENILSAFASGDSEKGLEGRPTMLKLANAVNWIANDSDQRRKRELQDLAGELMLSRKK